ncbi:DNA polymerase III subunit chi [Meridianimarinicoccus sp. RP-17]|uniref:DNA polymerase III subunit chi n=1 Tax=Meridianimarinicoccus zhengii TaxID=2056810 RepID=UPI000DAC811C|nr:DNA polymerase III subunit chi [Phycocomes zhengii]
MGTLRFYHVTRGSVAETLPKLLGRAFDAGLRVQIRCADADRAEWIDRALWLGPEADFLPHGIAGGPHDGMQPVLIDPAQRLAPGIACLMALDGAEVTADEVRALGRVFVIFDGQDEAAVARARTQWTALTGAGLGAEYWSEASGRWECARTAAPAT